MFRLDGLIHYGKSQDVYEKVIILKDYTPNFCQGYIISQGSAAKQNIKDNNYPSYINVEVYLL